MYVNMYVKENKVRFTFNGREPRGSEVCKMSKV